LQSCYSARRWLIAAAAQPKLAIAVVTPDVDLQNRDRDLNSLLLSTSFAAV